MKNTVFPHKFWRPFLDCMPQLFFRPQYVWFPVHLKGLLTPLWYETLLVNCQNWLFTSFHQSRYLLSPNPIESTAVGIGMGTGTGICVGVGVGVGVGTGVDTGVGVRVGVGVELHCCVAWSRG